MADPVEYRTLKNCNMRQEPSTEAAIGAVVQAGQIVHVDETKTVNGWMRVQIVNGWISGELLQRLEGG